MLRLCRYCNECWDTVHRRGKRQQHAFRAIVMCVDCGGSQPASRICSTCSASEGCTVSLCDVCFHSRHALRLQQDQSQDNAPISQEMRSDGLGPHRWTPLVQPCTFCGNFAARWLCPPCKEAYCANCYSQLHGRGTSLAHACNRLGYYTAEAQLRDEHFFRASARRSIERYKKELARNSEPVLRKQAALAIQRLYRAASGRALGLSWLQSARAKQSCQRQQTYYSKSLCIRQILGLTTHRLLPRDANEQIAVERTLFWKRARARYFILQNCTDACSEVDYPTDPKRIDGQGCGIGSTEELTDQAAFGGVRLPGRTFPVEGTKHVNVSHDLRNLLRPGDRIRIGSSLCRIHKTHPGAVDRTSLQLQFCWVGQDAVRPSIGAAGLCLYRLPPQGQAGKMWTMFGRIMYENQLTQILIKGYCGFHLKVCQYQRVWARRLHHRLPKIADQLQKWSTQHDRIQQRTRWWTTDWQQILESRGRKADRSK